MRFFRLLLLLLKAFIGYIWRFNLSKIGARRAGIIFGASVLLIIYAWALTREDEMDRDFKGAKAEKCTFWTRTYPMRQFAIYAVDGGEKQYMRMDPFVSGATGRQAEYIIVNSGNAYVWNTWNKNPKEGVKFSNAPVAFREYFGLDNPKYRDITGKSWEPVKSKFIVPTDFNFIIVTAREFEQNKMYTSILKTYIKNSTIE